MNPLGPQSSAILASLLSGLQTIESGLAAGQGAGPLTTQLQALLESAQESPEVARLLEGVALPPEDATTERVLRGLIGEVRRRLPEAASRPFQMPFAFAPRRPALPPINIADNVVPLDRIAGDQPELYGDKASRLAQMRAMDFPIPPAVSLSSNLVRRIISDPSTRQNVGNSLPEIVSALEAETGLKFGDRYKPLIVSVRSGGQRVMEGLLPTLQFVGLNSKTVKGLGQSFHDMIGAYRLYLHYVIEFGVTVRGVPRELFGSLDHPVTGRNKKKDVIGEYKRRINVARSVISHHKGGGFPEDPYEQLQAGLVRIAEAWNEPSARLYRERYRIPEDPPAALLIQKQIFGNLGRESAAICAYSRHPKWGVARTREQGVIGIAKLNASGDELMTGSGDQPQRLADLIFRMRGIGTPLQEALRAAERHFKIPVKFEAIVENGKLWILQVSPYPMWPIAILRSAVDMREEGIFNLDEAVAKVDQNVWNSLASPQFEPPSNADILLTGRTEIAGAVQGRLISDYDSILAEKPRKNYILITDGIEPAHWEKVFERVSGIVVLGDPGAHFFHRASQAGVAVMSRVKELGKAAFPQHKLESLVRRSARVWLDATGMEAYLTDRPLQESYGTVARFLKGEVSYEEVIDMDKDRSREQIEQILRFRNMEEAKRREDAARAPAVVDGVMPRVLARDSWDVEFLKETILNSRWGKETKPPAELFMRHDGSTDPSLADFHYEYEEERVAEFVRRLWEEDARSPKRLAMALADTDELEHAFATSLFVRLPDAQKAAFLDEFAVAAQTMGRKPGRGSGIYILSRMVSLLSDRSEGAGVLGEVLPQTAQFLLRDAHAFFRVFRSYPRPGSMEWRSKNEVQGIALKYHLLREETDVLRFLQAAFGEDFPAKAMDDESMDREIRLWLAGLTGHEGRVRGLLDQEEERRRPPKFDEAGFKRGLPRGDLAQVVDYCLRHLEGPLPIPSLELVLDVPVRLEWGKADWDIDEGQWHYDLGPKSHEFIRAFYEGAKDFARDQMLDTYYGGHAPAVEFFLSLGPGQKAELMERMVAEARRRDMRPGYAPGIFLLARFVSVLGPEGGDALQALSAEAFSYVLQDYFVVESLRSRAVLIPNPHPLVAEALGRYIEGHQVDSNYIHSTYGRYPGLNPRTWIPLLASLAPDRLQEALSQPDVPEGVRVWFAEMIRKHPR
ncbi:MAG TPA: hypothetical protein VLJ37_00605 [bacterium]|nr:hypothetical protein [bacterium]